MEKYQDTAKFIGLLNDFKKSMDKLYADLRTVTKQKAPKKIEEEHFWNISYKSTWVYQYHFLIDGKVMGFSFVISVDEENFHTEDYKSIMNCINVEPKTPLILLYGIFDHVDWYNAKDWWKLCLGYHNWSKADIPEKYTLGRQINIKTGIGPESSAWFSSAKYKIVSMLEIDSQEKLEECIIDLFSMANQ